MAKQGGRRRNSMGLRGGTCGICCVLTSAHRTRRAERLWLARRQNEQGCLRQSGEACLRLPERGSPKSSQRRLSGASSPTCPHSLLRGAITTLRKDQQGGVRRRGKTGYLECAALRNLARNVSSGCSTIRLVWQSQSASGSDEWCSFDHSLVRVVQVGVISRYQQTTVNTGTADRRSAEQRR